MFLDISKSRKSKFPSYNCVLLLMSHFHRGLTSNANSQFYRQPPEREVYYKLRLVCVTEAKLGSFITKCFGIWWKLGTVPTFLLLSPVKNFFSKTTLDYSHLSLLSPIQTSKYFAFLDSAVQCTVQCTVLVCFHNAWWFQISCQIVEEGLCTI